MGKEFYIKAHEELIEEYLEANPDVSWSEAYEKTADKAYDRARDNYANFIDQLRDRNK